MSRLSDRSDSSDLTECVTIKPSRLDKEADEYCKNSTDLATFVERMDVWLSNNHPRICCILISQTKGNTKGFAYEIIKACFKDLGIPCNDFELHVICRMFDRKKKQRIRLAQIEAGLARYLQLFHDDRLEFETFTLFGDNLQYVQITFKFIPFEEINVYPGNFTEVVTTDTYIQKLHQLISNKTEFSTETIALYNTRDPSSSVPLMTHRTLRQYEVMGGPKSDPTELLLFYTIYLGAINCPIIQYDVFNPKRRRHRQELK